MADAQIAIIDGDQTQVVLAPGENPAIVASIPGPQGPAGAVAATIDGSAALPSIAFASDTDTGLYRVGANQLGVSTGGTQRLVIDSNGQIEATSLGTAASPTWTFVGDPNTGIYSPGADQVAISTNGTGRLFIDASGKIGIGYSTPGDFLDSGDQLVIGGSSNQGLTLYSSSSNSTTIYFADSTTGTGRYSGEINYDHASDSMKFSTASTERMRLDSSGRLGLGTSSASSLLHVSGPSGTTITLDGANDYSSTASLLINQGRAEIRTTINASGGNPGGSLLFRTRNNSGSLVDAVTIDSSQRVGIGTTSPGDRLELQGGNFRISANSVQYHTVAYSSNDFVFTANAGASNQNSSFVFSSSAAGGAVTERARIDSSGRLLVGTSTARTLLGVQTEGVVSGGVGLSLILNNVNAGAGPVLTLGRSRGGTLNSNTILQANDALGYIGFNGADGVDIDNPAAVISAFVDGTPGANDMPGRLVFSTTADGASSPTERMRIEANGNARFSNLATIYPTTDNAVGNGGSGFRWSAIWAANGTIQTSDQRAKTDVTDAGLGSSFIKSLRPVSYRWVEGGKRDTGERDKDGNYIYELVPGERTHWGFIAQEVKEAVDAAGVDFGGWVLTDKDDPDSQQALRYDQFIAPLTKALQEALAKIETLEAKVAALEAV